MSLLEHGVFSMAVQAMALGVVCSLRACPPRIVIWVCVASILAFAVPWSHLGILLRQSTPHSDVSVYSATLEGLMRPALIDRAHVPPQWETLGIGLWMLGTLAGVAWTFLHAHRALARWRAESIPVDPDTLCGIAHSDHGTTLRQVDIRLVSNSLIAMTSGFWRPTIWLGDAIRSEAQQRAALNHELAHVKSGDQYLVLILTVLERVLWWNPFVWLLAAEARRQIEYDCDQRCKHLLGEREYTHSLVELSLRRADVPVIPGALALQTRRGVIDRMKRIRRNYAIHPGHIMTLAAFVGVSAFASSVLAVDGPQNKPTLMQCEKEIPENARWHMSIDRDPESRTISVSLQDMDAVDPSGVPEGSGAYMRCLFSALGIPDEERPPAV